MLLSLTRHHEFRNLVTQGHPCFHRRGREARLERAGRNRVIFPHKLSSLAPLGQGSLWAESASQLPQRQAWSGDRQRGQGRVRAVVALPSSPLQTEPDHRPGESRILAENH